MLRLSIRARLTFVFSSVIALVLVITSASLINIMSKSLQTSAENSVNAAMTKAQEAYFDHPNKVGRVILSSQGSTAIEITNLSGTQVWAVSSAISTAPVLARYQLSHHFAAGIGPTMINHPTTVPFLNELSMGQATLFTSARGEGVEFGWVYGNSLNHPINVVRTTVITLFGLLLLIAALLIWLFIGVTLAPVEAIRRRVASIAEQRLNERVTVSGRDDEINRLAVTVNQMLDRLEASSRFQKEFVSNASHELRSPLTTLLATVDLAASDTNKANWVEVATTVQREGRRLHTLIDDLFWLARSDEDGVEMRKEEVDLDDLLFEEATRVRSMTALRVDTANVRPTRVWGDPSLLRRAVRNVVDNAMRYATSSLSFTTRFEGAVAVIQVHDDGVGVDVANADKYFQRFVREDVSRNNHSGGTGLGLAIVADIAKRHGGTAKFIPADSGSTVELRVRRY